MDPALVLPVLPPNPTEGNNAKKQRDSSPKRKTTTSEPDTHTRQEKAPKTVSHEEKIQEPVEKSDSETSPGSIVAIWGKYNKALYYKIVQEEPLLGQFLFLWGGQRYYDGETPSIEPINYETIVYFNVPHAVVNGKYLIKKKTRDQAKRLVRDSYHDIVDTDK